MRNERKWLNLVIFAMAAMIVLVLSVQKRLNQNTAAHNRDPQALNTAPTKRYEPAPAAALDRPVRPQLKHWNHALTVPLAGMPELYLNGLKVAERAPRASALRQLIQAWKSAALQPYSSVTFTTTVTHNPATPTELVFRRYQEKTATTASSLRPPSPSTLFRVAIGIIPGGISVMPLPGKIQYYFTTQAALRLYPTWLRPATNARTAGG